jgi:hypothetical protein
MKCLECGQENFKAKNSLYRHIRKIHGCENYYIKFFKKEGEGFCKICNIPTQFVHIDNGYKNCCSTECSNKYTYEQTKNGNLKKYGVENPYQRKDIKKKIKQKNLKNFGVKMPLQNKEIKEKAYKTMEIKYGAKTTLQSNILYLKVKETKKKKYGDEKYINDKKIKETNNKKYGCDNPMGNKKIREKRKKTMIKLYGSEHALKNIKCRNKFKNTCNANYGVDYPMQNSSLFEKQQKSGFRLKKYKNTQIFYQASYELDFLKNFYNKYPDIERAFSIKYIINEKTKIYYPDFYIPSLNLIIECKNSYLAKRDSKNIEAKKKAVIDSGFNYIMIIDKDYSKLDKFN